MEAADSSSRVAANYSIKWDLMFNNGISAFHVELISYENLDVKQDEGRVLCWIFEFESHNRSEISPDVKEKAA